MNQAIRALSDANNQAQNAKNVKAKIEKKILYAIAAMPSINYVWSVKMTSNSIKIEYQLEEGSCMCCHSHRLDAEAMYDSDFSKFKGFTDDSVYNNDLYTVCMRMFEEHVV